MTKIAVISRTAYNYFFPGQIKEAGGQGAYRMARYLAKFTHYDVTCVVGDFGQPQLLVKDNVKILKAPINNPFKIFNLLKLYLQIDPDIFIEYCASPRLAILNILKRFWNKKYIYFTASDIDVNGAYKDVENILYYMAYIWGLKKADAIISQIPKHKDILKARYSLNSTVVLSPYFEVKEKEEQKKNTVLWVGRAAYYKRPDLFMELVKENPEYQFVMICNPSQYDSGFNHELNHARCVENLEFHDYIPGKEMNTFFRKAKVLINTSEFEGFSNTFIEAAREYTPVISLNSNPNNMLSIHKAGYFCQGDFQVMKQRLKEIMDSDRLQKQMGKNAFYYAKKFHQIDRSIEKVNQIIQGML